jgi:periplasmic copper chaperone A
MRQSVHGLMASRCVPFYLPRGAKMGAGYFEDVRRREMSIRLFVAIAAGLLAASSARAHILLDSKEAAVGADYKAVFVVPHGCARSATVKLRVQIPEGVIVAEALPKPGWTVETIKGKYAADYDYHGAKASEGVKEVPWSGGKVPDKSREEFVIGTFLTDHLKPNTTLYFPVVQECEQGISRWIEIPSDGTAHSHEGKWPAPGVKLTPKP